MNITLEKVGIDQKPLLGQMLKVMHHREDNPDWQYPHLDNFWTKDGHLPFFILADGEIAGLVMLDKYFWILPNEETNHGVADIYVKPEFRLKGIARAAMFQIWDRYPGGWEIRPLDGSKDAQAFWERTIGDYTRENYRTTCFGKYKRPLYTLQVPVVEETGHEIIYREAYMGF